MEVVIVIAVVLLFVGALTVILLGIDNKRIKCVDEDVNDDDLMAILISHHISKAILPAEELHWIYCMAGNPNAKDLLKVVDVEGREYWCDEIEFTKV